MVSFTPPQRDIDFLLFDVLGLDQDWAALDGLDVDRELATAIVSEGGKLASEVLAPINGSGDAEGCSIADGVVSVPAGFDAAFKALAAGGWLGLAGNPAHDGQGMPKALSCVLEEMFYGCNSSLYLYGTLTVGAAICIDAHGSAEQKATYLPKLYSGEWTGAMALTESHAGTDLGIMRTTAEPQANGTYSITGTKIFITSGDHQMADNIVHLVLARLPDAPAGSKGISLFIVPKYLPGDDGTPGERNGFAPSAIEHKMGIRGSATCVMNYDGATGFLLGAENQGLAGMFTMMNYERLSVGIQGLGLSELAYQNAASYARDRLQGRSPSGVDNPDGPADSLLVHPDVRRMLLTVRAYNEAGRAFAVYVGQQLDRAKYGDDAVARARVELLTPIAKAYLSDRGFDCAVLAQQVFGGHGYIAEWGMEQIVRDARISQIYEGANGVQALDLIGRKVLRDGGRTAMALIDEMREADVPAELQAQLHAALDSLVRATDSVRTRAGDDPALPGAASSDYLELWGLTLYAWLWGRMSACAPDDEYGAAKRQVAAYFYARLLPKYASLLAGIEAQSDVVMGLAADAF
ncbi:MAG: acyl-CoA dehydrogenase family protein [Pseudomonadota bacterium]